MIWSPSLRGADAVSEAARMITGRMSDASQTPSLPGVPAPTWPGSLDGLRHVHLLGLEGVGLSAAAELLRARGIAVSGSDAAAGPRAARLAGLGVEVRPEAAAVPPDVDLIVASAAVPAHHPRLLEAGVRGLPVWKYARLVGALMAGREAICIAGCHGKTTTTSLVASALLHAGRDPAFLIGGTLLGAGTGAGTGRGKHFVAESCEYDRSFHQHRPRIAVVLNVDRDHLDYYRDLAEIQESFRVFASRLPPDGLLVAHASCARVLRGDPRLAAPLETYGFESDVDWRVGAPHTVDSGGRQRFTLRRRGQVAGRLEVPLLGRHNALNASAAAVALLAAGLSFPEVQRGLAAFGGVGRRLECVAQARGVVLLDDYGHHPTEIRATIDALRGRYPGRRLVVIFQPHQASRTRTLLDDFAAALTEADEAWIAPIYFARDSEEERRRVSSEDLVLRVRDRGGRATALPDLAAAVERGVLELRPGDVVVTMGAGNVDQVARDLAERLR